MVSFQVFFSLGISWGGIIMFGSYNKFDARVHMDVHIVSVADFLTSLLASIVVFSSLSHSAHVLGIPVETVAKGGQGLAFVVYPEVSVIRNQRKGNTLNFFQALSQLLVHYIYLNAISSWIRQTRTSL